MTTPNEQLAEIIGDIIESPELHGKWLNTLSFMENCGARKISRFQDRVFTSISILKHAAEEARHAYFLKKLIRKIDGTYLRDFRPECLFNAHESYRYLDRLDVSVSKYLRNHMDVETSQLKYVAYLLVTYAIELRAEMLYDIYQKQLTEAKSRVNVKSIIAEEEGHLKEMEDKLTAFTSRWREMTDAVCGIEQQLYEDWIAKVGMEVYG